MVKEIKMTSLAPLTVVFEDLMRHYDQFLNYESTPEFLEFVNNQEECRKNWYNAEEECKRLQRELENSHTEIARHERKIQEIRKHLEGKMELLNKVELEKDRIGLKNNSAKALIKAYLKDGKMNSEFRERLNSILGVLESGERGGVAAPKSPARFLDNISEVGSTDLSITQSEDDLDMSVGRSRRRRSKRASLTQPEVPMKRSREANTKQTVEVNATEQLIAKTVVSFPKDGPVHAVASLETYQSKTNQQSPIYSKPSAPPITTSDSESEVGGWIGLEKGRSSAAVLTENQRFNDGNNNNGQTASPRFGRTLNSGGAITLRPHAFCQKTVIKPETCEPCGKRIKFSKMALKCRDCKATCHPECKEKVPIPCVSTGTPSNKHQMGSIADYVPAQHQLVPALIQHCVNEIEVRGLDTVGLYRVPGPEREVKDLKEKFLRGKGVPNLAKYDIHAVCGCIKDFLRSLQEPLVKRWFWRDFAVAADIVDPIKRQAEVERLVQDLPPPNQDTLAFMILHLQRIAECPEVKMSIGNLAKVFGPTIVGYSENDLDAKTMLRETKKQQMVLDTLLTIPSEFWQKFVYRSHDEGRIYSSGGTYTRAKGKTIQSSFTPQAPTSVSSVDRVKSNGKKIYFSDDSPKDHMKTRSQKRTFFD